MQVIIEADGGSRGNPGIAGSGSVIYDGSRTTELKTISYVVGEATNNVAEYHGLLNGLRAAAELGATEVDVRMDSKLVIEQMSGRWKIKHPDMQQLALECKKVVGGFNKVTFTWIPRKENARADELANIAMDAAADGSVAGTFVGDSDGVGTSQVDVDTHSTGGVKVVSPSSWNGATTKPTRFLLLRHGQTEMSVNKLYSGRSNPPLTEQGLWQADRAAERIAARGTVAAIVASPLIRCQQTAQIVADKLDMPVNTHDDLIEVDFGQWEGLSFAQAHEANPQLHTQWLTDPSVAPPDGESLDQADARTAQVVQKLCQDYPEQTVLLVSHVTPIKAIIGQALGVSSDVFNRLHLDLASFSIAEFYADGPTCVRLVNDCSHLKT